MMTSNKAAWIKKIGGLIEVETVEKWFPGCGKLLVAVEAVNFNPIDAKLQRYVYGQWLSKTSS
jgi:NADPH:quinone reductase-like Zn-dependent oxidoreductase